MNKDAEQINEVLDHLKGLRNAWDNISAKENSNTTVSADTKGSFSVEG